MFLDRDIRVACLDGDKLKGNGELSWCGVNDIIGGAQQMERARVGVERCVV